MPLFEDPVLPKSRLLLFQTVFALAQRREKEEDCLKGKGKRREREDLFILPLQISRSNFWQVFV